MRINLTLLLQIAAVLHLGLMGGGLLMPRVVRMSWHLYDVPPFIRQLFWVYYSFIGLCLLSFSVITFVFADTLAAGGSLARAFCAFLAAFWTLRLIAAIFVFDMEPYLTNRYRRFGYHALNAVFAYLPVVYVLAASQPHVSAQRTQAPATDGKLNIIAFGAHPDDCDQRAGGVGAKYAALGHRVRFVSVTNGDAGHQTEGGGALAARRRAEAREAGRRIGVDYVVLDNHDGELLPTVAVREQIIRQIRLWNADLVLAPRPNDYHPDHRYTGTLVQDAAYMVVVPNVAPDTPALRKNPVFMYFEDGFQKPQPFAPDVAVSIDDVIEKKIDMLDAHVSQMYEWLPWVADTLEQVPKGAAERRRWLRETRAIQPTTAVRATLVKWYGAEKGNAVRYAEAFEICEYGTRPNQAMIRKLFPFLP